MKKEKIYNEDGDIIDETNSRTHYTIEEMGEFDLNEIDEDVDYDFLEELNKEEELEWRIRHEMS